MKLIKLLTLIIGLLSFTIITASSVVAYAARENNSSQLSNLRVEQEHEDEDEYEHEYEYEYEDEDEYEYEYEDEDKYEDEDEYEYEDDPQTTSQPPSGDNTDSPTNTPSNPDNQTNSDNQSTTQDNTDHLDNGLISDMSPQMKAYAVNQSQQAFQLTFLESQSQLFLPVQAVAAVFNEPAIEYRQGQIVECYVAGHHWVFHANKKVAYRDGQKILLSFKPLTKNQHVFVTSQFFANSFKWSVAKDISNPQTILIREKW